MVLRGEQRVALFVKRYGLEASDRLIADIGDAEIQLEIFHGRQNADRGVRGDGELHRRIALMERQRHRGDEGQGGRDHAEPQMPADAALERIDVLAHGARIADDPARPVEHPLALGREAAKPGTALDDHHAELLFEALDGGGKAGLGDAGGLGGASEMPFAGEEEEKLELVDHFAKVPQRERVANRMCAGSCGRREVSSAYTRSTTLVFTSPAAPHRMNSGDGSVPWLDQPTAIAVNRATSVKGDNR